MEQEIIQKIVDLRKAFGGNHMIVPSIAGMITTMGKDYVDLFKKGRKCVVDLRFFKKYSSNAAEIKKRFKEDWEPITITYRRHDIIFFTWDNYPDYKEEYIFVNEIDQWSKKTYLSEVKLSEVFTKKIRRLKNKNPRELILQLNLNEVDTTEGHTTVINDIQEFYI